MVSCLVTGEKTVAVFHNDGNITYSITTLKLQNIPGNLQSFIQNNYSNFHVLNAVRINNKGNDSFQVILENDENYVTLKSDGENIGISTIKNASGGNN
jgi:hypothetical protein